jgi:uncharacterized protein (TIGR03435 family)
MRRARIEPLGVAMPGARLPERIRQIVAAGPAARISRGRIAILFTCCAAVCALFVVVTLTRAQSPAADWEKAAGGKLSFEISSVKLNRDPSPYSAWLNIAIEPDNSEDFKPSGGLFDGKHWPLWMYIAFAYKLNFYQAQILRKEAPKWVVDDNFDIQGRAPGDATKDQFRLMMRALLADRFKMAAVWQTREGPVDALQLIKPGKTGPQLRPFPDGFPCGTSIPKASRGGADPSAHPPEPNTIVPGGFPAYCGLIDKFALVRLPSESGGAREGARDVTWDQIENYLSIIGGQLRAFDRPVVDETSLAGNYDVIFEVTLTRGDPNAGISSFLEALRDQLGIKVQSKTGPAPVLAIDHIQEPTPN